MPISLTRSAYSLLTGCALSVAPLAVATIVAPVPSWAACDPQQGNVDGDQPLPAGEGDCQPGAAVAAPIAAPPALPPLPALSPSDVDVNVFPGEPSFTVSPPSVGWSWPQVCLPNIQTPIPFVGFQPCI